MTRSIWRHSWALVLALAACVRPAREPQNVLLITLDTTRADALGCYGAGPDASPALDALAAEGARFEMAIATASVTPVSHASILTGLDNQRHGLRVMSADSGYKLPKDVPTLTTELQARGWRTGAIHGSFAVGPRFGLQRGFEVFESFGRLDWDQEGSATVDKKLLQRRAEEIVDRALAFLDGDPSRPFLLWLHLWEPHDWSVQPPREFVERELAKPWPADISIDRKRYLIEVRYLDQELGRLFAALRARGLWDNTLIVVVADHGEGLGDHGWVGHRLLYQEQIRVPLILRIPEVRARVVPDVVRTTDIVPTLLDFLDLPLATSLDGRSLRPLLEGRADAPRRAFADQVNAYDTNAKRMRDRPRDDFLYVVIDGRWKLVWRPAWPDESQLFDLASDPRESHDLSRERPAELVRLGRALAEHAPWVTAPFPPSPDGETNDPLERAMLEQLGYAEGSGGIVPTEWSWTCPEHRDRIWNQREPCPRCQGPPLLIKRP